MATTRQGPRSTALAALGLGLWLCGTASARAEPPRDAAATAAAGPAAPAPAAAGPVAAGKDLPRWNAGMVREVVALKQPASSWSVAFSSDGKLLAAAGISRGPEPAGWVTFWDTATWKELRTVKVEGTRVWRIGFVPDRPLLVVGGIDGSRLYVCDPRDGSLKLFSRNTDGGSYAQSWFVFAPDGSRMMSVNPCDGAMIWDTETWLIVQNVPGARDHEMALALDPADPWQFPQGGVYATDLHGVLTRCAPYTQSRPPAPAGAAGPGPQNNLPLQTLWRFDRVRGVQRPWGMADLAAPAVSLDGRSAALCVREEDHSGHVDVYDVSPEKEWARRFRIALAPLGNVYALAFTPDATALVAGCADRTVRLWDAATAKALPTLAGHAGSVIGLAFAPEGKFLATSDNSETGTVKVWSPRAAD